MAIRWNMSKGMEVVMHRDDMGLTIVAPAGAFEMTYEKYVPGSPGTRDPLWQNDEWRIRLKEREHGRDADNKTTPGTV